MSVERIIGIDFGTSTSLVKVKAYRDGQPVDGDPTSTQAVEFDNGRVTTPTLIRFAGDAEYYGQDAVSPKLDSTLCKNFKLDLQSPNPAAKAQAQELTRKFFRFLYEQYSGQSTRFGQFDAERTLVSYPAKWKPETREFMLQAARDAGFKNVSGMDEPTAALYTVMVQESARLVQQGYLTAGKPAYVLMIDMGAGTTDLALCKYTPGGRNRIIDTWPPAESAVLFGGREMDELLIQYLVNYLKRCDVPERMVSNFEKQNLEACKAWKEDTVSATLKNGRSVADCAFVTNLLMMTGEAPPPFPAIDRAVLEDYCKDYIGRYAELIAGAMAHARLADPDFNAGDLSLAVLTGGHSQWYFAKDMLCCALPGYEGGVGVQFSADQVVTLRPPQHTVSSGLVFSTQFPAPEPEPVQRANKLVKDLTTEELKIAAELGDATAQNRLGLMYYQGKGVPQDYAQAAAWMLKSAEQGNPTAQCNLGDMYGDGLGVSQDYAQAAFWYQKAAEQGDAFAQNNLGRMYYQGKGIPQDYVQAVTWYQKAAEQGNASAQNYLALMYYQGEGVSQDYAQAAVWFQKSAEQGNAAAQFNLGTMYEDGEGVPQDYAQAVVWFRKAAEQGHFAAQTYLGFMYSQGKGVPRDYAQAAAWYRKAAEQGYVIAQFNLADMYEYGKGISQDYMQAVVWYQKAAEQGDTDAKNALQRLKDFMG